MGLLKDVGFEVGFSKPILSSHASGQRVRFNEAIECSSEEEARLRIAELIPLHRWPVYFSVSDTTGEKDLEEFYTDSEIIDNTKYRSVGVIKNEPYYDTTKLECFESSIKNMRNSAKWSREDLITLFKQMIPGFHHLEKGKFLDQKM